MPYPSNARAIAFARAVPPPSIRASRAQDRPTRCAPDREPPPPRLTLAGYLDLCPAARGAVVLAYRAAPTAAHAACLRRHLAFVVASEDDARTERERREAAETWPESLSALPAPTTPHL